MALGMPTTASTTTATPPSTAPVGPVEAPGSVAVPPGQGTRWQRYLRYAGPGLLVSIGYMDPGNWATDIEAGSRDGYRLLFVVLLASLAAMLLQTLCVRLGVAGRIDLARGCRLRYGRRTNFLLWLGAEIAIAACDLAEVLGSALALHLLFGLDITTGIAVTAFDTLIVLALQGAGFRLIEAICGALALTIAGCFVVELALVGPDWLDVAIGFAPMLQRLHDTDALYLAIGIVGATVMPHNLYLHSSVVQTRRFGANPTSVREAIRYGTLDTVVTLTLALLVNAAILILAAGVFHRHGGAPVTQIEEAYHLLDPLVGSSVAALLFGVALLAAGQSSTFTGTLAGQIVMDGFLDLRIPGWQRRLLTRAIALVPAFVGVAWFGAGGIGKMLVLSQVVLSFQLPFAIWPLLRLTGDARLMGAHANGASMKLLAWSVFGLISAANLWLVISALMPD